MKTLVALLFVLPLTLHAAASTKKCHELLNAGLTPSEVFAILASKTLATDRHLPSSRTAASRLARLELPEVAEGKLFASILEEFDLTPAEWKSIETIELDDAVMGTASFTAVLSKAKVGNKKLTAEQRAAFLKLNEAVEAAREKLKTVLSASEQVTFSQLGRLMTEEEFVTLLQRLTHNPKLGMDYVGVSSLAEWRYRVLTERESLRKSVEKSLEGAVLRMVSGSNEIPETDALAVAAIAEKAGMTVAELESFFGPKKLFKDVSGLISQARGKHTAAFVKVIDRRVFSGQRRELMLKAIREANDIILFKLAENQDMKNFAAVRELSRAMGNCPIIVAPAFAEIGLIPEKLDWLFNEPGVHFMVDRGIQVNRDTYIVDHGYEDKRQNPFVGLEEIYAPTDKVIEFHPRVRAKTRATGNYDTRPGYMVTTGSMSDPAYWGHFKVSMSTDDRAQIEAEMNRSVLILSRRYRSEAFGGLVGSANGIAPRRARYTDARYGNPDGLFDLGKIYSDNGVVAVKGIPALVLGDIHLGNTDPLFLKATREALERLNIIEVNPNAGKPMEPNYRKGSVALGAIVLHDLIEGSPNNRHNMDSLLSRAIDDKKGALDLSQHVQTAAAWIKQLTQLLPDTQIIIPVDNHGSDWLVKRLQEADLFKGGRPKEVPLILQLMVDAISQKANPYKRIFQYYGIDTDQVHFMSNEDTYRAGIDLQNPAAFKMVQGVEIGQHSHMGVNGAKSISLGKLLSAYGANVTGHTHSSAEHGTAVKVGTGTPVRQGYHRGPSSSDSSIALVYSELAVQLLRMEKGSFVPSAADQSENDFFPGAEYPRALERKMPPGGHTTDQFRNNPPVNRHPR